MQTSIMILKSYYSIIFITNLPAFYKIKLYNKIDERLSTKGNKILVIFIENQEKSRNADFYNGQINFDYIFLHGNKLIRSYFLYKILKKGYYDRLILQGWDHYEYWLSAILSPKQKNCVVVESSIWESKIHGIKGFIKKIFISRIKDKVFAPGISNGKLARLLGFKGEIIYTKGVGIFNTIIQPKYVRREKISKFLFVGRLVKEKNLKLLINVFNELPQYTLTIVGFGEQEKELKHLAKANISFLGAIENKQLSKIYQSHDVFILPSQSETWGLVVEEALNNGLPVIVSEHVGCHEAIVNDSNGLVFSPYNSESALKSCIFKMTNISFYNDLRRNISQFDFEKTEEEQVACYL